MYETDFLYYLLNEMGESNTRKPKDLAWLFDDSVILLENLIKKMKHPIFLFKTFNNRCWCVNKLVHHPGFHPQYISLHLSAVINRHLPRQLKMLSLTINYTLCKESNYLRESRSTWCKNWELYLCHNHCPCVLYFYFCFPVLISIHRKVTTQKTNKQAPRP